MGQKTSYFFRWTKTYIYSVRPMYVRTLRQVRDSRQKSESTIRQSEREEGQNARVGVRFIFGQPRLPDSALTLLKESFQTRGLLFSVVRRFASYQDKMLISACSVVLAVIWTSIAALAVVVGGGGVGEGSGAEKALDKEPGILTT